MKTINLKKYYYPIFKKDIFVEVPDEVARKRNGNRRPPAP